MYDLDKKKFKFYKETPSVSNSKYIGIAIYFDHQNQNFQLF